MNKFLLLLILPLFVGCHDISFDSNTWKNSTEKSIRWDMSNDLMKSHLAGKSVQEVYQLLGYEELSYDNSNQQQYLSYSLGPCRRGIDYGTLVIYFENGNVSHSERRCN